MKFVLRSMLAVAAGGLLGLQLGGCPTDAGTLDAISGGTGDTAVLRDQASVEVITPSTDLSIAGGAQVTVNWRAFARSRTSVLDVIVDTDRVPNNGNERTLFRNLPLGTAEVLLDTTSLDQGTYFIGVVLREVNDIVAFGYAPGTITIDQAPRLSFSSPRDNLAFDRSERITPGFNVAWQLTDPDTPNNVTEIYLDPDDQPNGNELLLYRSNSQTGDSFRFDLPTAEFEAGTYRILAVVSDGTNATTFYAPTTITLRARLAGVVDLRDMGLPGGPVEGAIFEGVNPRDNAGSFVSTIGDLDGDGFDDFIILSQFGKPRYQSSPQGAGIGEAYIIYGRERRFSGFVNLNSTGTLFRGEIMTGPPQATDPLRPSRGMTSFTLLSDWDGDGVREMAFGVPFTDSVSVGGFLAGGLGFNPAPHDQNGYFRTGGVVVIAGSAFRPDLGFPGRNVMNLSEFGTLAHLPLAEPTPDCPPWGFRGPKAPPLPYSHEYATGGTVGGVRLGCRFSSAEVGDQFGETVSSWDFDSIVMSGPNRDPQFSILGAPGSVPGGGVISVYFVDVKSGFYPWTNDNSPGANADLGYPGSQQSAGDRLLPHGGPYHYVTDDLRYSPGYTVDPDNAPDPCSQSTDYRINTPEWSTRFWSNQPGARVSNAKGIGDMNGDGLQDLMIGVPQAREGAGAVYVILGRNRDLILGGELQLEQLSLPMNSSDPLQVRLFEGIQIVGAPGDRLGQSQDYAFDFNGDGLGDIVIGSPFINNRRGGAAVFFGSREAINVTELEFPFDELPARGLGVVFVGEEPDDLAGARVAGIGDFDGDGNADILIAAPNRTMRVDEDLDGYPEIERVNCGVVYLIYGSPNLRGTIELSKIGTEALPGAVFVGRNTGDFLAGGVGQQGDRSTGLAVAGDVDGDGVRDLLITSINASPRQRVASGEAYLIYGARR